LRTGERIVDIGCGCGDTANRTRMILKEAGYAEIEITPFDTMIGGSSVEECLENSLQDAIGVVIQQYPTQVDAVKDEIRAALARRLTMAGVMMKAAIWIVSAKRD